GRTNSQEHLSRRAVSPQQEHSEPETFPRWKAMETRREFLTKAALATALGWLIRADRVGMASSGPAAGRSQSTLRPEEVLDQEKMKVRGKFYHAEIPDTLDLAERARLALNYLTHNVDPDYSYYVYQVVSFDARTPGPAANSRTMDLLGKNLRALPWMRTMCGSDEYLDRQHGMMNAFLKNIENDGLMYFPQADNFNVQGTTYPDVNGMIALAA